jgi:vancomycin resistance protein YoaR
MAVTEQVTPAVRALRVPRPGRGARRFVLGTMLGIAVVLVGLVAYGQAYAGRILPGVRVGGVDVGGLTPSDARQALVTALGPLEAGKVTVGSWVGSVDIAYDQVGRKVDYDAMVDSAARVGRDGTRFAETVTGLRAMLEPVSMPPVLTVDRGRLDAALASYGRAVARGTLDASVVTTKKGYVIRHQIDGVQVDTTGVATEIEQALLDPATPPVWAMRADASRVEPATTDADAMRAQAMADQVAADLVLAKGSKSWKIKAATIRGWITFSGSGAAYGPRVDPVDVPAALKKAAKDLKRKPTEALYLRTRSGQIFGVSASRLGRALDKKKTAEAVVAALAARGQGRGTDAKVKVATALVAPKLSTDEAKRKAPLMVKLGTWTTRYQVSAHNGFGANITVPARKLDGVVVKAGALFDFWGALGEVSFRTGYRLGGAIVGGHSVEGKALAGGICAASTTLFNAAARGGLQIVTRSPHWYYITRYPLGLDATVSGSQSMRFRNDTKYPILIKTHASGGIVTFEIWSVPNGRQVTWSRPSVSNVVGGFDTVKKTSSLKRGQTERIEWPVDGKDVSVSRTVRDANGRVIHRDTWVSHYHRMIGITLVGTR